MYQSTNNQHHQQTASLPPTAVLLCIPATDRTQPNCLHRLVYTADPRANTHFLSNALLSMASTRFSTSCLLLAAMLGSDQSVTDPNVKLG